MLYRIEGIPADMINPTEGGVPLERALRVAEMWRERPILYNAHPLMLVDENGVLCDEQGNPLPP